jgi:phospholipase/carboxylesterase
MSAWPGRLHLVVACAAIGACESRPSVSPPREQPASRETPAVTGPQAPATPAPLEYLELITGGAAPNESLPLIVAIHGLGDRPDGFAGLFAGFAARARVLLPAGPDPYGSGFTWFPFGRDRDPERLSAGIRTAAARIAAFVGWAREHRATHGRPVVTGFSQGGMITFALALEHPGLVAAALPIGGLIPGPLLPEGPPDAAPPILTFHGAADAVVPLEPTQQSVARLQSLGYAAELRVFPGVGHAVPASMRAALHEALEQAVGRAANEP